jgi:hypothetical protein
LICFVFTITCAGGASKSGGVIDSLGAFATFLGCCLFLHQPITLVELDALEVAALVLI